MKRAGRQALGWQLLDRTLFTSWHHFLGSCKLCCQLLEGPGLEHGNIQCVRLKRRALLRHPPRDAPLSGVSQIIWVETMTFIPKTNSPLRCRRNKGVLVFEGPAHNREACKIRLTP